jgi:osmotically-inducible protein OsmY
MERLGEALRVDLGEQSDPSLPPNCGTPLTTMKKTLVTLFSIAVLSIGAAAADEKKLNADNTGKNERDRSGETKTPVDQSNTPEDLKITQSIRQAVVKDKSLTMTAKNMKIITAGGQVTLRGPVNSAEEKTKIEKLAKTAAGEAKVDNQLEVKAADKK